MQLLRILLVPFRAFLQYFGLTTKSEDLPPVQNGQLSREKRRENTREKRLDGQSDVEQAQETTTSATPELKKKKKKKKKHKKCDNTPWTVVPNKKPSKKKPSNQLLADGNLGDPLDRADDGDEVFDFAIYDDTIAGLYKSERKVSFDVEGQESFSIDVARFFSGYLKITSGFISSDRIRLNIKKIDKTKRCVLKVKKYDPQYGLCFHDRSHTTPWEDFRDSDSTTLSIDLDGAIKDLKEYSKERKEFGLIELWLEWDSTRQIVVPSFHNYQLQMGRTQIAKSARNRIDNRCTFIKEAFFDPDTRRALIVPKAEGGMHPNTNLLKYGLRYLHKAWRVSLNVPEWIETSPTKPLGINLGNPRTWKGVNKKLEENGSVIVQFDLRGTGLSGYFELRKSQGKLEARVVDGPPPQGWNNGGESQRSSRCSSIRS
ncbi:unnamed protein product, partial [Mesorhabditis belari]|uniref:Uncharacterized protein n=1 Tax=Mesorhabditis belari TaxID=2138241 RepID=A0AAF3EM24_9BILA